MPRSWAMVVLGNTRMQGSSDEWRLFLLDEFNVITVTPQINYNLNHRASTNSPKTLPASSDRTRPFSPQSNASALWISVVLSWHVHRSLDEHWQAGILLIICSWPQMQMAGCWRRCSVTGSTVTLGDPLPVSGLTLSGDSRVALSITGQIDYGADGAHLDSCKLGW